MTAKGLVRILEARGVRLEAEPGGRLAYEPTSRVTPAELGLLRRHKAEILALLRPPAPATCPLCGSSMRHFRLSGTDMFACDGGCPGARIARRLGFEVPGCGRLYRAALERAEQRAKQGEMVGEPS